MAKRKILKKGDDTLRMHSREVTSFDDKLGILLDDMAETMYKADGVGLAAPQIGILRRVVVMDCGNGLIEMVNPVIVETSGKQIGQEGCLSVPGVHGSVERPAQVKVEFFDRKGKKQSRKFTKLEAVCTCHETDHLDGILFIDKVIEDKK